MVRQDLNPLPVIVLQHSVFLPLNYEPSLPCAVGFQLKAQPGTPWVFGVLGKGLRWNRTTRTTQTIWGVKIKKNRPCLLAVKRTVEPAHSSQSVKESIMAYAMPNRLVTAGIEPAIPRTFPRRYSRMTTTESAPV